MREFLLHSKKQGLPYEEAVRLLNEIYKPEIKKPEELKIPISVFDNRQLSALEAIVKFLHENKGFRFSEIARLINRDQRAIGVSYRFASRKMSFILKATASKYSLPLKVIAKRKLSVLESIAYYLKQTYSLSYHEVALLLKRDDRTVWTVYQRALRKL